MSAVALNTKQLIEDKEHEGGCKSDQGREYATPKGDQGDEEAGRAHDMAAQDYSRSSQIGRAGSFSKYRQVISPRSIQHGNQVISITDSPPGPVLFNMTFLVDGNKKLVRSPFVFTNMQC